MIVKNVLVAIALLFSTAGGSYVQSLNSVRANIATDGEHVGLSKMPSLSPEDSDTAWFHENTLLVKNDEAILDEVPVTIRHGQKEYSASDGGFLTYRARFIVKDGQSVVAMRLVDSMYIIFPRDKRDQYVEIKTYPVKFVSGQLELLGVRYRPTKLSQTALDRLLHLLSTEPLEKIDAGL
jgi:hypothetical protein